MTITHVFAGIPVADLDRALAWYERLLGRPPDGRPHEAEAVWHLSETGLIYVVTDVVRAGRALVTLIVDDLAAERRALSARGIEVSEPVDVGDAGAVKLTISDPDGNEIGLAQVT